MQGFAARSAVARAGSFVFVIALTAIGLPGTASAERAPVNGGRQDAARVAGCTIIGTAGPDRLVGGPGRDIICGLGGNDVLLGGGGRDVLRGGPGDDVLRGGSGADVLRGGEGDDVLRGGSSGDRLYAGPGDDHVRGGTGNDVMWAGSGNDVLRGGPGRDTLQARDGAAYRDVLACGAGARDRAFADTQDVVGSTCEANSKNAAPVAADDSFTTLEDTRLDLPASGAGGPLANDSDPNGDPLTVTGVSGAAGGTVELVASTISFTPAADLCGPAASHFDYTISDGRGGSDVGRVSVAITCVPEDPTANDDLGMVQEDASAQPLTVLANDVDPDGDPLVIDSVTQPDNGTVAITGGGSGLTYLPDADYCNQPPGTSPDTFTYTLTPGGATATVTVLVLCVDDVPVAVDDDASLTEDDPATAIDVLANDGDVDGGPMTITSTTAPAHGTVVLTGGTTGAHTGLTYEPDADYCNDGTPTDDFSYTLNGGSIGDVQVTVTCVDDLATAADDIATVAEDSAATIDVLLNDSDVDGGPKTITAVSQPAHGTVVITNSGADLTYTPAGDYCNGGTPTDDFTYTLNGTVGTVATTVTCVNDAPVNHLPAGPVTAVVDAPTALGGVSVTDVDAGNQDVQVQLSVEQGTLTLSESVTGGVGPTDVSGNGTSDVTLTAPLSEINATLAAADGIVYQGTSGYSGPDTLTVVSDDLGHAGIGGALTDTDTLAIGVSPPNQPPVAAAESATTDEDAAKTVTLSATDADGDDPLTFVAGDPAHGTLGAIGAVTCDHGTPNTCSADVVYTPDSDYSGPDTFTYTANDGTADSSPASVDITVTPVNDAPSIGGVEALALAYTENDPATAITSTATVSDADSSNFDTGTLTVDHSAGGTADDRLAVANAGQISVSGSSVSFDGTVIGTYTGGSGTTPLVVTLDADATTVAVQALVRAITYRNVSDDPSTAARTARFVLTDGDGGTSTPATRSITLTAVNDAPALADVEASALAYTENDPATAISSTLTVTDPDSNVIAAAVSFTAGFAAGDTLSFVNQLGITGSYNAGTGVLTLAGSASAADYRTALRSIGYSSSSEDPSTATRTVGFQVTDGQDVSDVAFRDVAVTAVNDAPVADDDAFGDALGNTRFVVGTSSTGPHLTAAGDVLAGDTDVDTPVGSLTAGPGTITSSSCTGTCSGNVTMEVDGQFTYDPPAGFTGNDTFTYTVTDNDSAAPANQTDTGTVTITVVGPVVWYVDGDAASAGDGRSISPVKTLSALSTGGVLDPLDGANDVIFVYDAATSYAGGLVLEAGQRLIGEPSSLDVDPNGATPVQNDLVPAGGSNPVLVNASGNGLVLASGNTIQGINLGNASGTALAGTNVGTATMNTVTPGTINNATGQAVNISAGTLAMSFSSLSATGGTQGIRLDNTSGTFTATSGTLSSATGTDVLISGNDSGDDVDFTYGGTISDDTGPLVTISDQTGGTKDFNGAIDDNPTNGNGGGISVQSNSASTVTRFDGGLTLSTGTSNALNATNAGTLAITDPGGVGTGVDNTLTTTTGTPLTVSGTTIHGDGLVFRSIAAGTGASGPANAIVLNSTGPDGGLSVLGTGSAGSGGTIQRTTSDAILLTSTRAVRLDRMVVSNSAESGILGSAVNGLSMTGTSLVDNGDDAGDDGIRIANLTGANAWTALSVTGSARNNVFIDNSSGTLASLHVTGASHFDGVGAAFGSNGFLADIRGTSTLTSATIDGATFSGNKPARGLTVQAQDTGSIGSVTVQNSTFANDGLGASFEQSGAASHTFSFVNNTVTGSAPGQAVNVFSSATSTGGTLTGKVSGNQIGSVGVVDSGSTTGSGIRVVAQGGTQARITIANNTIREVANGRGIDVTGLGTSTGTAAKYFKITGNTVVRPSGTTQNLGCGAGVPCPLASIFVTSDTFGAAQSVCSVITGNTAYDPTSWPSGSEAAYLLAQAPGSTHILEGNTAQSATANLLANNAVTNQTNAPAAVDAGVSVVAGGSCGTFP